MTTENTNPEQEQLPEQPIQNGADEKDGEEEQEQVSSDVIVSRELAAIPIAEREGVQKFAKDDVFIRNDEVKKIVKKYKKKFDITKFPLPKEGEDEKAWLAKVQDGRRICRNFRTELEEEREARVKPHNDTVTFYNGVYKPLITDLKAIESPLKSLEDTQKEAAKKRELQKEIDRKAKVDARVDRLKTAGAKFDGSYYYVGDNQLNIEEKSLGMIDIETASDTLFEDILTDYKKIADAVNVKEEEIKLQKKKEKDEKEEQDRKDKQKLIDDQAEVNRKQKILDDQKKEQDEKIKKLNVKIDNMRRSELLSIGIQYEAATNKFSFAQRSVPFEKLLHEYEDETWETLLTTTGEWVNTVKEEIAAKEKTTLERQAQLVELGFVPIGQQYVYKTSCRVDVSRLSASEDDWKKVIQYANECIEKANIPAPVVVEKKEDAPIESGRPVRSFGGGGGYSSQPSENFEAYDAKLFNTFKALLSATHIPEFKSDKYKKIGTAIDVKIKEIISL